MITNEFDLRANRRFRFLIGSGFPRRAFGSALELFSGLPGFEGEAIGDEGGEHEMALPKESSES